MTDETDLRLYPVEHDLRGLSAAQLADARRAPGAAVRRAIRRGSRIRYVPRIWAPLPVPVRVRRGGPRPPWQWTSRSSRWPRVGAVLSPAPAGSSPVADREQDRPDG